MREKLLEIANKYGTPVYVYDLQKITSQYKKLKKSFKIDVKIKYACKALSNIAILKHMKNLGSGLEAVSIEEINLGIIAGFKPSEIVYTPSSASFEDIEYALKKGVDVNIEDLQNLEEVGKKYGSKYFVGIRINPSVLAGGNKKISTGHADSKFGIPSTQIKDILKIVKKYDLKVKGLHIHTGSDIYDVAKFMRAANVIFELSHNFDELKYLDLGSGFKVKYKQDDKQTNLQKLGQEISKKYKSLNKKIEIWLEPGKFLVSEAGYFLVNVNTIKRTSKKIFVGVNSGLNHLIRPMFYDAYHEIKNISNLKGVKKEYDVVGYICEEDTFAKKRIISNIRKNDVLCFYNAGAYCYMMASNYNSKPRPAEVIINKDKIKLIRKRESFEDLIRNQLY